MVRVGWLMAVVAAATVWAATPDEAAFRDKIQPILNANCVGCHSGPQAQGGLSMANLPDLLKGGKRGPALRPGQSSHSLLVQFVRGDQNPRMPIGGKPLAEGVISALAAAIDSMQTVSLKPAGDHASWVFSPPVAPKVPTPRGATSAVNPIDAFVLAKLENKGIAPAPAASRRALLRRLYFDLIGLPPTEEEARAFLDDASPGAYEKLVDKLLADRRYGERWARHWLDLVRFAESDGFAIDGERPTAWRYRDYVVRAFNNDKPYDLFVQEQLAGDELQRRPGAQGENEGLLALGFLRMGPWERDANFDAQLRLDWLNEMAGTTTQAFLGLTVGCARCHDHKYDPIPQKDFYRMQAFFAGTRIDERPMPFLEAESRLAMRQKLRRLEDELEGANADLKKLEKDLKAKLPAMKADAKAEPDTLQKALNDKANKTFTAEERKLHKDAAERVQRLNLDIARHQPVAYSVNEVAPPAVMEVEPTFVLAGGERSAPGAQVEPGFPERLAGKSEPAKVTFLRYRSGRRRALAEWITSPANPLTARVMVNRIWQHHFGEGLVRTPSDFGMNGDRPSHPELLDWLATQFIEKKWSVKAMHRMMLLSSTYRQSTRHPESARLAESDPENRLLARMNWIRIESEALRDSILSHSGGLNPEAGGPGMFFHVKDEVAQGFQMFKWYPSDEQARRRRSLYAFQRRSLTMPLMEVFDAANMSESCSRRSVTTVAPQALTLLNGELTAEESRRFAARVIELAGPDPERQIHKAFTLTLVRQPTAAETQRARALYEGRTPQQALTRLGTVLFNLNEFLYLE